MATDDDEYDRYFIPKGTIVIGASWYVAYWRENLSTVELELFTGQFCMIPKYLKIPKNLDRSATSRTVN